jgi:hypothetical protein
MVFKNKNAEMSGDVMGSPSSWTRIGSLAFFCKWDWMCPEDVEITIPMLANRVFESLQAFPLWFFQQRHSNAFTTLLNNKDCKSALKIRQWAWYDSECHGVT